MTTLVTELLKSSTNVELVLSLRSSREHNWMYFTSLRTVIMNDMSHFHPDEPLALSSQILL